VPFFSNNHPTLPIVLAPGVAIGANSSISETKTSTGTSQAVPHVAGEVAILRGSDVYGYTKSAAQIVNIVGSTGSPVVDRNITKTRVNIQKAISPPTLRALTTSTYIIETYPGKSAQVPVWAWDTTGAAMPNPVLTWSSSNTAIARVDGYGNVTGVSIGSVSISIKSGSISTSATVSVKASTNPCYSNPNCGNM
jgi:uncharacterized protein YjdB